jgi:hypothetical protein
MVALHSRSCLEVWVFEVLQEIVGEDEVAVVVAAVVDEILESIVSLAMMLR